VLPTAHVATVKLPLGRNEKLGSLAACTVWTDGTIHLWLDVTPNSTLKLGAAELAVPAGGLVSPPIDLDPLIIAAPIPKAIDFDGTNPLELALPLTLTPAGGPALTGELALDLDDAGPARLRTLLRAVATDRLARAPAGAPVPAVAKGTLIYVPVEDTRPMAFAGASVTVGELDLVAIARDGEAHVAATGCGPYEQLGVVPQQEVSVDVDVYEVSTGNKLGTRHVATGYAHCPTMHVRLPDEDRTVKSRPDADVVMAELRDLITTR
jgi:hypothetical protein